MLWRFMNKMYWRECVCMWFRTQCFGFGYCYLCCTIQSKCTLLCPSTFDIWSCWDKSDWLELWWCDQDCRFKIEYLPIGFENDDLVSCYCWLAGGGCCCSCRIFDVVFVLCCFVLFRIFYIAWASECSCSKMNISKRYNNVLVLRCLKVDGFWHVDGIKKRRTEKLKRKKTETKYTKMHTD